MQTGRNKILYFGLDPSRYDSRDEVIHYPLIRTIPFPYEAVKRFLDTPHSHLLFTSRSAVRFFFAYAAVERKKIICVGKATAEQLRPFGLRADWIAPQAQGEGVIELLKTLEYTHILYPHSAHARSLLPDYLEGKGTAFPLYDTVPNAARLPDLAQFSKYVFTSPSTVEVFATLCAQLPPRARCEAIGPITRNALNKLFDSTILQRQQPFN